MKVDKKGISLCDFSALTVKAVFVRHKLGEICMKIEPIKPDKQRVINAVDLETGQTYAVPDDERVTHRPDAVLHLAG